MLISSILFAATTLHVNPDKQLHAKISKDTLNRITVIGDRIQEVYGDEESYSVKAEESTGQIFLKPNIENQDKPISLTMITESGVTQDLVLKPVDMDSQTILLKNEGGPNIKQPIKTAFASPDMAPMPTSMEFKTIQIQDEILASLKRLVSQNAPAVDSEVNTHRRALVGIDVRFREALQLGRFKGLVFELKNNNPQTIELREETLFQQGDLAIAFDSPIVASKACTRLFVVTL